MLVTIINNATNIYNPANILKLVEDVGGYFMCDIISGDGGFDFSNEFNNQELNMSKLIYAQILTALICNKKDGIFILKMFDLNYQITYDLLYILETYYNKVEIYKPCMSRIANSEKYIICTGYNPINIIDWTNLLSILIIWNNIKNDNIHPNSIFNINPQTNGKITQYNSNIIKNQIIHILNTINLIKNPPHNIWITHNTKIQKELAIEWCQKYNIPYND